MNRLNFLTVKINLKSIYPDVLPIGIRPMGDCLSSSPIIWNFPLKYFLGDNENAIIIQIWSVMLANLLLMILKSQIKRKWAFSNMVSVIRQHLMSYIDARSFFENPEKAWQELIEEQKSRQNGMTDQYSLFPQWEEAYF